MVPHGQVVGGQNISEGDGEVAVQTGPLEGGACDHEVAYTSEERERERMIYLPTVTKMSATQL